MEFEEVNDEVLKNLVNELKTKNIIYEKISAKNYSEKISELFENIAKKYNEFNKEILFDNLENEYMNDDRSGEDNIFESEFKSLSSNSMKIKDSNVFEADVNENLEKYSEYHYKENKSNIDFNGFQKKTIEEKNQLSEFETILLKECLSDSNFDSNGSFNVSFEKLGYQRKVDIYNEIMGLLSKIINNIIKIRDSIFYHEHDDIYDHFRNLIIEKKDILDEEKLKEKYIYGKRNKNEEEDYSNPVFALTVNYSENILKVKENVYEDIAKELLHFISVIYFENNYEITNFLMFEFSNILYSYKTVLMMEIMKENNELENNYLLNKEEKNLENEILVIIFIDKGMKNKKIYFLEDKDNYLRINENYISFFKLNDLNEDNLEIYINDKKYAFSTYFVPKNEEFIKSNLLSKKNL